MGLGVEDRRPVVARCVAAWQPRRGPAVPRLAGKAWQARSVLRRRSRPALGVVRAGRTRPTPECLAPGSGRLLPHLEAGFLKMSHKTGSAETQPLPSGTRPSSPSDSVGARCRFSKRVTSGHAQEAERLPASLSPAWCPTLDAGGRAPAPPPAPTTDGPWNCSRRAAMPPRRRPAGGPAPAPCRPARRQAGTKAGQAGAPGTFPRTAASPKCRRTGYGSGVGRTHQSGAAARCRR